MRRNLFGNFHWHLFYTANSVLIILHWLLTPLPQTCLDFATVSTENQTPTGAHRSPWELSALCGVIFWIIRSLLIFPPHSLFLKPGSALQMDMGGMWSPVVHGVSSHLPCPTNINRFSCLGVLPSFGNHEVLFLDWMFLLTVSAAPRCCRKPWVQLLVLPWFNSDNISTHLWVGIT